MNARCFKTVFSEHLGCLVAVGEHASSQGKSSGESPAGAAVAAGSAVAVFIGAVVLSMAWVGLAWATPVANALPTGGQVVQGAASMVQSSSPAASQLTIHQASQRAAINWQSFDIGAAAKVNVVQPNAQAVLLNRVVGQSPSQIFGKLQANGHVILVNPNGVLFGKDGSVNAGSFTASTLGITDANFMAGNMVYERNGSTAGVVNQGTIQVAPGGYVALLGASVSNEGKIIAPKGGVALGAAETIKVPVSGSGRIKLELTAGDINASVKNSGSIVAEGGQVYIQALALNRAAAQVIQSGSIDTTGEQGGAVHVLADGGTIKVSGSITANSTGTDDKGQTLKGGDIVIGRDLETGVLAKSADVGGARLESNQGFVETSGDVLSTTGTRVKAGEWLLDPYNITIASGTATSTDYSNYTSNADSTILASDISANLTAGTSVTIATGAGGASAGYIAINENIEKTGGADATLTLQAHGNITVAANKTITSDTGKLNVVFNSDLDVTNGGGIVFNSGSGITSNGGNITLGGGSAGNGSGFATADGSSTLQGISLNTATISASGGSIVMNGLSPTTSASNVVGILMSGGTITTTGAGQINLTGKNQLSGTTGATGTGFSMSSGTITGGSTGAVTIEGNSSTSSASSINNKGAIINGTVTSTGGDISVTGFGGAGARFSNGVDIGGRVLGVGSANINITGTAASSSNGGNVGVTTSGTATVSSVNGNINITGTGGTGNGDTIRNHGVSVGSSNAIQSTGSGNVTVTGRSIHSDTNFSQGVVIGGAGLRTNSGNIRVDGQTLNNHQVAVNISAPTAATTGNVYIRSVNAGITNSAAGVISGNNVSIENTGGSIDANGVITPGTGGATTWVNVQGRNGIDLNGSVTAADNLNIYGNQTNTDTGVRMSGATTTISGKNVTLYGRSSTGNGVLLSGATLSGQYINATGLTNTGYTGFAWSSGNINTTGTTGTSTASTVKGISAASTTASNGYGAFMMFASGATNAASGTTLTLAGEATTLSSGQNTKERGILVQGGYTLTASGDITLDGSAKSSDGISFGGTITMATVAGVTNKLTLRGTTAASSNSALSGVNFSGAITGNAATSSINIIGEAKNLSGANIDNAVNTTGSITGSSTNVNIQALYGKVSIDGAITGANISVDNTGGTIDATTGAITAGAGTSLYTNAVNINKALTATGNINVLGRVAITTHTGVNLTATAPITSSGAAKTINVDSTGNIANAAAITNTGSTGTGANINLTSTSGTITGAGAIGDTTNKNASVKLTHAATSTYSGAINATNFTKGGAGVLTLNSWVAATPATTNISNAYTVESGGLTLDPGSTLAWLMPASVNVVNASTFSLATNSSSRWNNTAFNFTGGSGGGTMNLGGNPIGAASTTNIFSTTGGATNTVLGGLNANGANIDFNLTAATSGTGLLEGGFAALAFTQNTQGGYGLGSSGAGGNAGTVNMSGGGHLLFKDSARATTFNINAGNVQVGDGSAATASATAILDATNVSIAAGSKLTFNRAEAYSNASVITGTGSLIQAGAGTLTLTGNSTAFAGGTTVNAGKTLAIGTGGSLGAAGSTLSLADSASSLLFTEASGISIVGSTVSGAGSLSHSGAGTGVLTANNNYSGATTVSGGTLQIGNATTTGTLGTANAVTLSNNATLAFNRIATTTIDKTISGNGNVTANITGDLALTSNIALTGSNTINLTASGSITEASGSLAATNLYMTATTGNIGSTGQRIQSSVNNMALTAAGDAFVTEANGVSIAANVGNLDLSTTNGTLNVSNVNSVSGITASTGNVTLSGTTDTGNGIYIGSSIMASNGTVTLDGTTSSATSANAISPDAGVKSIATVTAKNINMTASATAANGGLLGYYGGGNLANFIATEQLALTGAAAGTGNGFYSYIGTFSSGTGMSIAGTSTAGQGVGLVNGITMTNGSTGDISITGTATDGTKQGIGLRGIAITNGGGNTVLTAVNGVIATDAGNPAWNTGVHTNTITSNGTGYVHVIAGNGSAANTASIDGTVFNITQNGNAGVLVSTSGTGNVTAPKITNVGTGDIVVAAGTSIAAGTGTGGQILTVANNALTQTHVSTPGKTYVYSGSADATGVLSHLSADFATLYYQGTSQALNTGFNQAFDANHANDMSVPSGGSASSTQVFFRSTTKPGFSMTLANSSKAYGDTDPNLTTTSGAILTNAYAGVGGNNAFAVASADVIDGLTGSRDPGGNVGTYAYNLSASGFNTTLTSQPNLVIGKRDITLASIVSSVKTYDGTDAATIDSGTFGNIYNNETLLINGAGIFSDKNAGTGKTVTVADVTALTKSDGTGAWSNYNLTTTGSMSTTGSITPAPLVVQVNNSSAFVTMNASQAVDNGLSYSGFVNGETAASALTGTGTRTYLLGTTTPVAGTHINSFGLSATPTALHGNYIVTVQNGNLTVVPADKLLISIASKTETYGVLTAANAGASASTVTAQYCLTSNCASSLVDLTVDHLPDGSWRATDVTGTAVTFSTLIDSTGHLSTGGFVNIGNYTFDASATTPPAALNFNGRMVNGGVLTVQAKSLTLDGSFESKTYDGSRQALITYLGGVGVAPGDVVALQAGNALFSDKNVARDGSGNVVDKAVTVSGLSMTGLDAGNYGLASNNFTGIARITPRLLSTIGTRVADKTQDGTAQATVSLGNLVGLVGVETLQAVAAASFDTAATGSNKAVNVSYTLSNGTNGGLAGNYSLPNEVQRANILASSTLKPVLINPVQTAQVPASDKPGSKVGVGAAAASVATLGSLKPALVLESQEKCSSLSLDDCDCTESKLEGVDICLVPAGVAKRQLPGLVPVLSDAVQR